MADDVATVPGTNSDVFGGLDVDRLVRNSLPQSSVNEPKIVAGLKGAADQEAREKAPLYEKMFKADDENLKRMHAAADGIQPVDLKPWDAKKEKQDRATSPMDQFGSFAVIASTLASAFTRRPMSNALNGAAAGMEAIQNKDQKAYDEAYTAFKDNTKIAIDRHNIQREAYEDAAKRYSTDHSAYLSQMETLTAKFGDKRAQALLDGGYFKELEELHRSRESSNRGMLQMLPQLEAMHAKEKAAMNLRESGKSDVEIYHELYAPAYSNNLSNIKGRMISEEATKNGGDWGKAAATVNASFSPARASNAAAIDADEVIKNLSKDGLNLPPEVNSLVRSTLSDKGGSAVSAQRKTALVNALEEIRAQKESGDKPVDAPKASQIIRDALDTANSGKTKIDQAIVNQFPEYEGMNPKKFGYVGVKNQERIMNAIQSSEQIEHIATYAADNPEAIGLVADAARKINVDAYHGLIAKPAEYIAKLTGDRDNAIDAAAKAKGLSQDQAAKAKVLNKMLATQAFADAGQAGSRGATIYLDKAFREIYQQASSPPAFFDILRVRQADSDSFLGKYDMGLKARKDVTEKFPFYSDPEAYLRRAVTPKVGQAGVTPPAGERVKGQTYPTPKGNLVWGADGFWYTPQEWEAKVPSAAAGPSAPTSQ
jgi:hypothetical protein